jgi:putative FmdB family regulatory protein
VLAPERRGDQVPTYQYACTECGHALEAQQSFTDDPLTTCPECSGRLRKVFSAVGVVFKGSGFYRNDSRSETAAAASSSDSGTKGDSSDPGSTTTTTADKGTSTSGKGAEKKAPSVTSGSSSSSANSGSAA